LSSSGNFEIGSRQDATAGTGAGLLERTAKQLEEAAKQLEEVAAEMGRLRSPPRPWIRRLASHLSPAPCRSSISAAFRPCGELCLVGLVHLGSGVRHRSVSALTVQVRSCSLSAYVFPTLRAPLVLATPATGRYHLLTTSCASPR
jgi:hypothetical protein